MLFLLDSNQNINNHLSSQQQAAAAELHSNLSDRKTHPIVSGPFQQNGETDTV